MALLHQRISIDHLKVVLCKNLAGLVELNILATRKIR